MKAPVTPLIAGNWKMNGTSPSLVEVEQLAALLNEGEAPRCTVLICPPATLLERMSRMAASSGIVTGGQDCHPAPAGPHTGDISAQMLVDAGAQYVIVGHSERRTFYGERSDLIRSKAAAALAAGLIAIICVGETEAQHLAGEARAVVWSQIRNSIPGEAKADEVVIAYEPVWAIGTGRTPSPEDIAAMHAMIRRHLVDRFGPAGETVRILYGGSMKPSNAATLLAIENVNGGLVGGASLLANDLYAIISAV